MPVSARYPGPAASRRRSEPLTRTVTVAASESQMRGGRAESLIVGGMGVRRNGSEIAEVPTASVASMTAA